MNTTQEITVLEQLAVAYAIIKKVSAEGKCTAAMSMTEFVSLQIAVMDAKKLIEDDVIAKTKN